MIGQLKKWWRSIWTIDRTPGEVADILEAFLDGTGSEWDWDDLTSIPIRDRELEAIVRAELVGVSERFPPDPVDTATRPLCSPEGLAHLRKVVRRLREMASAAPTE